jgi:heavy metal translocating P-type ATPase
MGNGSAFRSLAGWLGRRSAAVLLAVTVAGLLGGGVTWLAGAGQVADGFWLASAVAGLAYALWSAADSLRRGRLGVDIIALLALGGAVAVRELFAAAVISVMLASGRALEEWAATRARHDLSALLDRAPRSARRYEDGRAVLVPLDVVEPGDLLLVTAGEVVPVDGTVASDNAVLDESALTGEARPVTHSCGDRARSGVVNAGGPFDLRASDTAAASTYAGIVRLVSEAQDSQAPFVRLADRYALWFLPLTLATAAIAWAIGGAVRAVAVLVVATPCPLILAAPVALVSGLSAAARRGVVVKNGGVLERLARCGTLILDKTGTLTVGRPEVTSVIPARPGVLDPDRVPHLAAALDQVSGHVLASAIVRAETKRDGRLETPTDVSEVAGQGIVGRVGGHEVRLGRAQWTGAAEGDSWVRAARRRSRLDGALTVFVAVDGEPAGVVLLDDRIRPEARQAIRAVRRGGIGRVVLATGDRPEAAEAVGALTGADAVIAELTPEGKLDVVRAEQRSAPVIMTGDGINDAPALALADVGIALAARGASASSEAADAVLTGDNLARLGEVAAVARRTRRIALQSVLAGMGLSLAAMAAAAVGLLPVVRLTTADEDLTRRFRAEHQVIRADTDQLLAAAQAVSTPGAMEQVRQVRELLTHEVWPHEHAEESTLYPALNRVLGGADPTAPMSRAHAEIAVQIARLGRLVDDIGDREPDEADVTDLRDILYGLHAILRLHTLQEDETYLSLGDAAA